MIKRLLLVLLASSLLIWPPGVTAYEISFNFQQGLVSFYVMPDEEPSQKELMEWCVPGWRWERFEWVLDGTAYIPKLTTSGACEADRITPPENPADKLGV